MNVKIHDLMAKHVITVEPHHTVDRVRSLFAKNKISAVPVVGPDGGPVGVVTATDLVADLKGGSHVSQHMATDVKAVPAYNDVSAAARVMRKNKIHHVLVTHEKKVVGIISSYDLLRLVEDHRFVMKGGPTKTKKGKNKGKKDKSKKGKKDKSKK